MKTFRLPVMYVIQLGMTQQWSPAQIWSNNVWYRTWGNYCINSVRPSSDTGLTVTIVCVPVVIQILRYPLYVVQSWYKSWGNQMSQWWYRSRANHCASPSGDTGLVLRRDFFYCLVLGSADVQNSEQEKKKKKNFFRPVSDPPIRKFRC